MRGSYGSALSLRLYLLGHTFRKWQLCLFVWLIKWVDAIGSIWLSMLLMFAFWTLSAACGVHWNAWFSEACIVLFKNWISSKPYSGRKKCIRNMTLGTAWKRTILTTRTFGWSFLNLSGSYRKCTPLFSAWVVLSRHQHFKRRNRQSKIDAWGCFCYNESSNGYRMHEISLTSIHSVSASVLPSRWLP